ncbi:MAG: SurA N-terminal domain-containing protein [Nannocystaceae bacterium]|nr:SurA N-terminal domain-containing protein [bacterium]
MLDFLRQSSTSFWAWLILLALAAAFGLSFGLPSDSLSFGSKPIVEVHGTNVNDEDYRAQYSLISGAIRIPKDARMQKMFGVKEEVLESIIERELLATAGEDMGLAATERDAEEMVAKGHFIILGNSMYWTGLDQFNYKAFKNFLAAIQIPENRFLETQSREVLARTVRDLVRASVVVPEPVLREQYEASANKLSLHYARYEIEPFADLVDPSEDDVTAWVEAHTDDLKKSFETQGARFTKLPAQIRVSVLAVDKPAPEAGEALSAAAKAKIEAARARIDADASFRDVAREVSSDEGTARRGGDFGWTGVNIGTGLDPALDEALRSLEVGSLSDVIEGENDFFIARVEGKREGDVPEEDALRELAAEAIKRDKGKALARIAAEEDRDAVLEGKSLDDVFASPGAATGLEDAPIEGEPSAEGQAKPARPKAELRETGLFSKSAPIPNVGLMPGLVEDAWASDTDTPLLEKVYETQGALIIAGLDAKEGSSDEGFAEMREQLYAQAWARKGMKTTANWAERLCLEAKGKGDISVSEDKVQRIVTYDTETKEGEDEQQFKPYTVCDRVGNQGGLLRAAMFGGL